MTSKFSWILFIPFTIAAVFFKLAQTILPDGSVFGMNDMMLDYLVIGCAVMVFLSTFLMCVIDRKISQYYVPHRNIVAGILGLLLAVVCAADGANMIYLSVSSGKVEAMDIVEASLLILASIVFIVMGLTHSFVNRDNKNFALFNVMPALLCAIRLVRCFIDFTTISIRQADVTLLVCYVFATLFFFNLSVTISLTEAKHAVKSCFIFGFPAVTILLARGIWGVGTSFDTHEIFSGANAELVELVLMALYIAAFLIELTVFIKDRDHVTIMVDDGEEEKEVDEQAARMEDTYIVTGMDDENRFEADEGYLTSPEFNDYLIRATEQAAATDADNEQRATQSDPTGYITEVIEDPHEGKTAKLSPDEEINPDAPGYVDRLDMIDKLILELTEDYKD